MVSLVNYIYHLEVKLILLKFLPKIQLRRGTLGNSFYEARIGFWYQNQLRTYKKKRKLQANIPDEYFSSFLHVEIQNSQQNTSNLNSHTFQRRYHNQIESVLGMQKWLNVCKWFVIYYINARNYR